MDGPQRPKLVESSADHPGIRRIICLMTLNYISDLAHRNPPKLSQIVCLIAIQLSGKFKENLSVKSRDICLRSATDRQFEIFSCV